MTIQQILLILRMHYRLIVCICLASVCITMVVSLLMKKQYVASASIVIDLKADPISGAVLPEVASLNYIANQMEIMQSERVTARAVKLLGEDVTRAAYERWSQQVKDTAKIPFDYYYGGLLQKGMQVTALHGSNVVLLSYSGTDPAVAAAVANALAQAYIDVSIELRVVPAQQYAAWFEQRLKGLRADLEAAQNRLSAYQKENGIVATDERYDQEEARLANLSAKLVDVQRQRIETESRASVANDEASPDVMKSSIVEKLRLDLSVAEAKLKAVRTYAGINNPQRLQLESQVEELSRQLAEEIRRVSAAAAASSRMIAQQESELKALVAGQSKRVLAMRADHDRIAVLAKDVETARQAYEAAAQRMSQLNLEGKSDRANISLLSPAVPPITASRPRLAMNFLASLCGGLLLGITVAMLLEKSRRKVRGAANLTLNGTVPLLGVLRSPAPRRLLLGAPRSPRATLVLRRGNTV